MKKSNTNLTITITEGCQNIQFLLDFLANAKRDYLIIAELDQIEKLQQLLETGANNQLFEQTFPQQDIDNFLDRHGRPLAYVHGNKNSHIRYHIIPHCARKAYDMLVSNYCLEKLEDVEVERFAACDELYDTVVAVANPTTTARGLRERLVGKRDLRTGVMDLKVRVS